MSRSTGPNPATRQQVMGRNGGLCLRCSWTRADQIHHRKPRGMGGTRDAAINSPANLVAICAADHSDIESHRQLAYDTGWLVARHQDPATVPLITLQQASLLLADDGTYVTSSPFTYYYPEEWL